MRKITPLVLALLFMVCFSTASRAAVQVGGCLGLVNFTTIQAAVDASPAGTVINVCPGTYPEQVKITRSLTIKGVAHGNQDAAVIVPPSPMQVNTTSYSSGNDIAAQVLVQGTSGVNISNITVDGSNNNIGGCSPNLIGIFYQNASGTLSRVQAVNQALGAGLGGCQSGLGIFAQSDGIGGTSALTVSNSYVQNYGKNGITGNEVGTTLMANGNVVLGQGPTDGAAENSIQIGFGATGQVTGNTVGDDIWAPDVFSDPGDAAAGILIYDASGITTSTNTVASTQFGIAYVEDTPGAAANGNILSNKVSATHIFDGIDLCNSGNIVQRNIITGSDEAGIHLDGTCGSGTANTVSGNTISGACAGILDGGSGNSLTPNTYYNVKNKTLTGDSCTPAFAARGRNSTHKFKPARP